MGVTRWNLKPIVKGSGRYHRKRWNVQELVPLDTIKRAIAEQFRERIPWTATRPWIETSLQETLEIVVYLRKFWGARPLD